MKITRLGFLLVLLSLAGCGNPPPTSTHVDATMSPDLTVAADLTLADLSMASDPLQCVAGADCALDNENACGGPGCAANCIAPSDTRGAYCSMVCNLASDCPTGFHCCSDIGGTLPAKMCHPGSFCS